MNDTTIITYTVFINGKNTGNTVNTTSLERARYIYFVNNRMNFEFTLREVSPTPAPQQTSKTPVSAILTAFLALFIFAALSTSAQTWTPNQKFVKQAKATSVKASYQCYGTTQKGERCKRHVKADHSFCTQHANQAAK